MSSVKSGRNSGTDSTKKNHGEIDKNTRDKPVCNNTNNLKRWELGFFAFTTLGMLVTVYLAYMTKADEFVAGRPQLVVALSEAVYASDSKMFNVRIALQNTGKRAARNIRTIYYLLPPSLNGEVLKREALSHAGVCAPGNYFHTYMQFPKSLFEETKNLVTGCVIVMLSKYVDTSSGKKFIEFTYYKWQEAQWVGPKISGDGDKNLVKELEPLGMSHILVSRAHFSTPEISEREKVFEKYLDRLSSDAKQLAGHVENDELENNLRRDNGYSLQ